MTSGNSLHSHALKAEGSLEQLATGLAQAGADEATVTAVSKMAHVVRQIVGALGKGQEQTGDTAPPAPPAPQQPQQPAQTMDSATQSLHQDMQAAAAQRPR